MNGTVLRVMVPLGSTSLTLLLAIGVAASPFAHQALRAQSNGTISISGSSTVGPITTLAVEGFKATTSGKGATFSPVLENGSTGGFRQFCAGQTAISNASRPISAEELKTCAANGVSFYELPVAFDAITVVVNRKNTWAKSISLPELKRLWSEQAQGKVKRWNQVSLDWPNKPIALFGPGQDSGTFDTFNKAVNGNKRNSRTDYTSSENDNVLVRGVAGNANALGYFGFAYFNANRDKLRALAIKGPKGTVKPSVQTVQNGSYLPLSRPIFIYVSQNQLKANPSLRAFVSYYLKNATDLVEKEGSIPLTTAQYRIVEGKMLKQITGSAFAGQIPVGLTLSELLNRNIDQQTKRPEYHQ